MSASTKVRRNVQTVRKVAHAMTAALKRSVLILLPRLSEEHSPSIVASRIAASPPKRRRPSAPVSRDGNGRSKRQNCEFAEEKAPFIPHRACLCHKDLVSLASRLSI